MSNDNDNEVDVDDLTPEQQEEFMQEFRRIIDEFQKAGGAVLVGSETIVHQTNKPVDPNDTDAMRQQYIDAFVRNHENREIINAQKECLFYLEAGGYLN